MSLQLSIVGRCSDRWQVQIEIDPRSPPRALTVGLVSEGGRRLGPAVVVPIEGGAQLHAELRGPAVLPPGTRLVATADQEDGSSDRVESVVDARRGLHAFLHADGRLLPDGDPAASGLTPGELRRLARRFPWVVGCCAEKAPTGDGLLDMLCGEFDVDPDDLDDLDEDLVAALRR